MRSPLRSPSSAEVCRSLGGGGHLTALSQRLAFPLGSLWPGPAPLQGNIPKKGRKENSESSWPIGEDRGVRWEKWGGGRAPGKKREAKGGGGSRQNPRGRELRDPSGGGESALASRAAASWKICGARGGAGREGAENLALGTETGRGH